MVTSFNRKDMMSFGKFLLSDGRQGPFLDNLSEKEADERFRDVTDDDFGLWLDIMEARCFEEAKIDIIGELLEMKEQISMLQDDVMIFQDRIR
jgi:DNA-binding SARP family transcriptional activator